MGLVGAAVPPAAPIIVPVAATLAFAQWVSMVYKDAPDVLRVLMAYIADLTIVMQSIYWIVQARTASLSASSDATSTSRGTLDRRMVGSAFEAYKESGDSTRVHGEIRAFVKSTTAFKKNQRDIVLEKVIELIRNNRFEPPESYKQRGAELGPILNQEDDHWYYEEPGRMSDLGHYGDSNDFIH
ncbi:hypothetical protein VKT23_000155 [Stygiomarasmius scandens]|uniref:Uncharacterized protein n=1 Tax=Marasmiellus scandens TaxID=2682957 RepID=A0ABR1K3I5_9AGAR